MEEIDLEKQLVELHKVTVSELLKRIKSGAATSSEIAQAISMLKHDNIMLDRSSDPELEALEIKAREKLNKLRKEGRDVTNIDDVKSWKGFRLDA